MLVLALFDLDSEFNAIHPIFTQEQGLSIGLIDIGVHKIDGNTVV